MSQVSVAPAQKKPVPAHYGRPRRPKTGAWSLTSLIGKSSEEQPKLTQTAWRELEVEARSKLRAALRETGADKIKQRELKDLAVVAQICHSKGYPDQHDNSLSAHVPAKLLSVVSERILKSRPVPIDVTPEPQSTPQQVVIAADEPVSDTLNISKIKEL